MCEIVPSSLGRSPWWHWPSPASPSARPPARPPRRPLARRSSRPPCLLSAGCRWSAPSPSGPPARPFACPPPACPSCPAGLRFACRGPALCWLLAGAAPALLLPLGPPPAFPASAAWLPGGPAPLPSPPPPPPPVQVPGPCICRRRFLPLSAWRFVFSLRRSAFLVLRLYVALAYHATGRDAGPCIVCRRLSYRSYRI